MLAHSGLTPGLPADESYSHMSPMLPLGQQSGQRGAEALSRYLIVR